MPGRLDGCCYANERKSHRQCLVYKKIYHRGFTGASPPWLRHWKLSWPFDISSDPASTEISFLSWPVWYTAIANVGVGRSPFIVVACWGVFRLVWFRDFGRKRMLILNVIALWRKYVAFCRPIQSWVGEHAIWDFSKPSSTYYVWDKMSYNSEYLVVFTFASHLPPHRPPYSALFCCFVIAMSHH